MYDSLSIQYFINQLPDGWELGVPDLSSVASQLEDHGVVSSRDGPPLTFVRGASTRTPAMRVYKPIGDIEIIHHLYSNGHLDAFVHTMLATGAGKDESGTEYHEFQDSYGDFFNGDRDCSLATIRT